MNLSKALLAKGLAGCGFWNIEDPLESFLEQHNNAAWRATIRSIILPKAIISKDILFIHIPRNAGTSISSLLYGKTIGHFSARFFNTLLADMRKRPTTFTILRDPVSRAKSAYSFIRNGGGRHVQIHTHWVDLVSETTTFEKYLSYLEKNAHRMHELDFVARPQTSFVNQNPSYAVDKVFVMEQNFEACLAFLDRSGLSELPRLNESFDFSVEITPDQKRRLEQIYAADFDLIECMRARS